MSKFIEITEVTSTSHKLINTAAIAYVEADNAKPGTSKIYLRNINGDNNMLCIAAQESYEIVKQSLYDAT